MPRCFLVMPKRHAWIGVVPYLLTPVDTSAGAWQRPPESMPSHYWKGAARLKALFWIVVAIAIGLSVAQLV